MKMQTRLMVTAAGLATGAAVGLAFGSPGLADGMHAGPLNPDRPATAARGSTTVWSGPTGSASDRDSERAERERAIAEARAAAAEARAARRAWRGDAGGPASSAAFEMIAQDGDQTIEVVVRNEKVSAKVNGVRVADELVVREGDSVKILDDDGNVIKRVAIAGRAPTPPSAPGRAGPMQFRWSTGPGGSFHSEDTDFEDVAMDPPPVMLGVLLEGASDALQAQLGVGKHAIVLEKILDGLPAANAGLEKWDIIVEIDGEPVDRAGMLADILMESEPGDVLDLVVIRSGKRLERELKLEAYDAKRLGTGSVTVTTSTTSDAPDARIPGLSTWNRAVDPDAMSEMILQALKRAGGSEKENAEVAEILKRELAAAQRGIAEAQRGLRIAALEGRNAQNQILRNGRLIINDDQRAEMIDEVETRLSAIEGEMDVRLEALERRLDERWEKLEGVLDRMFEKFDRLLEKAEDN